MTKSAPKSEVRVKLLAADLKEGKLEEIVRLPRGRADDLIAAEQARLARIEDFSFGQAA